MSGLWKMKVHGAQIMANKCHEAMESVKACLENPMLEKSSCAHLLQAMFDCGRAHGADFAWMDGRPEAHASGDVQLSWRLYPEARDPAVVEQRMAIEVAGFSLGKLVDDKLEKGDIDESGAEEARAAAKARIAAMHQQLDSRVEAFIRDRDAISAGAKAAAAPAPEVNEFGL